MLIKGYMHYFLQTLSVAWLTIPGIIALLCVIGAIAAWLYMNKASRYRLAAVAGLMTLAVMMFVGSIYSGVYEIEQGETFADLAKEFPDDESCGTEWSDWFPIGAGSVNTCGKGCYRGATIRQEMKMVNFPPWPVGRREFQCWKRQPREVPANAYVLED